MKALVAASVVLLALAAGAAGASGRGGPSLRPLSLTPPTFRGSGFAPHERVEVTLRGAVVHARADASGRFRVRLAPAPACKPWTVRVRGARGATAVYRHARCAALQVDVTGVVRRPRRNVCSDTESCSVPAAGVTVRAFQAGTLVAETTTDGDGQFSFALADGSYTIQAVGHGTQPKAVDVTTSKAVHLALFVGDRIR